MPSLKEKIRDKRPLLGGFIFSSDSNISELYAEAGYDFVIIDSPPSLSLLTVNGLIAAKYVLLPVQAEFYALEGLGQLLETMKLVRKGMNPGLELLGVLKLLHNLLGD